MKVPVTFALAALVSCAVSSCSSSSDTPAFVFPQEKDESGKVVSVERKWLSHRGVDLKCTVAGENSLEAVALAKQVGADYAVNTKDKDLGEIMTEYFGPDKADVIYDCAGNDITMNSAIQNARKGSTIILVAVFAKMANVDLAKLNDSELDLNTSMMYRHEDYVDALRFVNEGKIQLKPLQSAHFAFKDYLEAYKYIDANRESTMKVIVDVDPVDD